MFTGLIEELGSIARVDTKGQGGALLKIHAVRVMEDLSIGDSVSVNGVCLTATTLGSNYFTADVMPETLRKTNLIKLKIGDKVNLERALAANGRLGGHIVTGHIDGVGKILKRYPEGNAFIFKISAPMEVMKYVVEKGSVTVDGISLTVAFLDRDSFSVSLIPHTAAETTLGYKNVGEQVNLEGDIVGKYIEKILGNRSSKGITVDKLRENGFF